MQRLIYLIAVTTLFTAHPSPAAVVSFSGGRGGPVTVTIPAPISYTATAADSGFFTFAFKGVGNPFHNADPDAIGTLTYSINGGVPQQIDFANSGFVGRSYAANDLYVSKAPPGTRPPLAAGDVVTLSAGTLTTTTNFADPAPDGGDFTTYLYAPSGGFEVGNSQISNAGVQVPETSMLCGLSAVGSLWIAGRRRTDRRSRTA